MLLELRFKDFVLIDEARLSFEPGFIVFTGETGAGKTLLVKGLHLLFGARAGGGFIRPGAQEAILEAVFSSSEKVSQKLKEAGIPAGDEIYLRRVLGKERSRAYVNDSPVTLAFLTELSANLLTIASQHDYQSLVRPEVRLEMVDSYGNLSSLRRRYHEIYQKYRRLQKEYSNLQKRLQDLLREEDYLRFQITEIEEISPRPGEDEEIEQRLQELKNLARLEADLRSALQDFEKAFSLLSRGRKALERASSFSQNLQKLLPRVESLFYEAEDLLLELGEFARGLTPSEGELERLEERFYQLQRLKRKYGPTLEEVFKHLEKIKKELETFSRGEEHLIELERQLQETKKELKALAGELREKRVKAGQGLAREVKKYLRNLALEGLRFEVVLEETDFSPWGTEKVEFKISTHPEAPLRPLTQVASGGELSRIFLALKTTTAANDTARGQVLIFDEVDVGVGGPVATQIGKLLSQLARKHQVFCITHQPQIAALADQHFLVEKTLSQEGATTSIRKLAFEGRVKEIARMLGGKEAEDLARRLLSA